VFPTDAEEQRVLEPLKLKKVLVELARQKKMLLLAGRLEGRLFTESTVRAKALLPGLDHLRGELLGLMQMPAQRLASLLQRTSGEEVVRVLDRMHK
jgi:large subunit ribosomal protein L10